jgi:hypothetical protein
MRTAAKLLAAAALALIAGIASAGTITWNFSYTGSGITATGTLTTSSTLDSAGAYDIIGVTGTRTTSGGTQNISSLLAPNPSYNDNELFFTGNYFDQLGLGYSIGSTRYDLYFNSQTGCGALGYREDNGSAFPYCSMTAPVITSVSVTRAVPEPGTVLLMTIGLALVFLGRFISKRSPAIV